MLMTGTIISAIGGLLLGIAFGALVERSNFCVAGALSDHLLTKDHRRLKSLFLATATAILCTQFLNNLGLIDIAQSLYRSRETSLLPLLGGLIFGYGMGLSGGCPGRQLVRLGGGYLIAVLPLAATGLLAYATLRGPLSGARLWLDHTLSLSYLSNGLPLGTSLTVFFAISITAIALVAAYFGQKLRSHDWLGGIGIGLLVTLGWLVTTLGQKDAFDIVPLTSFTFVAPLDQSIRSLLHPSDFHLSFGLASTAGVVVGAALSRRLAKPITWTITPHASEWTRLTLGGALMGFGGVLALGCAIGQGITGLSTLAMSSLLASIGIFLGGLGGTWTLSRLS